MAQQQRAFTAETPNELQVAGISYPPNPLAVVLDIFSRRPGDELLLGYAFES